ncbi:MAG: CPBP family intramembrane metalloprotease [Bacilli bacterium]|nr:CPBP family intramembrane metalloprotease [Bacilli bacterium]
MKKDILKAGLSLFVFNYLSILVGIVLMLIFKMDFSSNDNYFNLSLFNFVASLAIALVISAINFGIIKEGIKRAKETYKTSVVLKFLGNVIVVTFTLYIVRFAASYVSTLLATLFNLKSTTIDNQTMIESMLGSAPAMMIISACLLAPITEELLFRGALKKAIKNKKVFITVSGLTFGLAHITDSFLFIFEVLIVGIIVSYIWNKDDESKENKIRLSVIAIVTILLLFGVIYYLEFGNLITKIMSLDIKEIVGSISYVAMGSYLAYVYHKEDNILTTIGVHALSNSISVIILLFLA